MAVVIYRQCRRCGCLRLHKPLTMHGRPVGLYCAFCGNLVEQVTFESKPDKRQQGGR